MLVYETMRTARVRPSTWTLVKRMLRRGLAELDVAGTVYLRQEADLRNAWAEVCGDEIVVDVAWLRAVRSEYGVAAVAFVVFHELGHLVDCRPCADAWNRELYADGVAGQLLGTFGYDFARVSRFIREVMVCRRCASHPPARQRLHIAATAYAEAQADDVLAWLSA